MLPFFHTSLPLPNSFLYSVLTYLGEVIQLQHQAKEAIPIYLEALELSQSVNDKTQVALILRHLGAITKSLGQAEYALQLFAAATLWDVAGVNSFLPLIDPALCQEEIDALRAQIGHESFSANWEKGRLLTLDQALECALVVLRSTESSPDQPLALRASPPPPYSELTLREFEVLRLLVQGLSYAQIANELVISHRTVNTHATSIYAKLDVTSRAEATRFVFDHPLK